MDNQLLQEAFSQLSTPLIADACVRLKLPLRVAPAGIRPVVPGMRVSGTVLPAHHRGSVDVFLEAMKAGSPGDVLVVDNDGRRDESCVGDLTVLEARAWGLAGLVVRGYHRDTAELLQIAFPVFSYGTLPGGPLRLDPRESLDLSQARWDGFAVERSDVVFADDDGVIFVRNQMIDDVLEVARSIWTVERRQADLIRSGEKLSVQLDFEGYLAKRGSDPSYTLRKHLRQRGGSVEE